MDDLVLSFKLYPGFVAPPPRLGNQPKTVVIGTPTTTTTSLLYRTGILGLSEMGWGLALTPGRLLVLLFLISQCQCRDWSSVICGA